VNRKPTYKELEQRIRELKEESIKGKRTVQEIAILANIGRVINSSVNIGEVYQQFCIETRKLIPFDRLVLNLITRAHAEIIRIPYVFGFDILGRMEGDEFPFKGSLLEAMTKTRTSLLLQSEDERKIIRRFPTLSIIFEAGIHSLMVVPLISRDKVIGSLHFQAKAEMAYDSEDLSLAERTAAQIAGAIANAQLYADLANAEEDLREREERFRHAMEATADGLWDWDLKTDNTYYSPSYYRMLGYEPSEFPMTGQAWVDSIHPDDKACTLASNQDCIENRRQSFEIEYRLKTKGGTWKWILGRGKATSRDSQGRALRMIGTHVDITERKQAEKELRKSKEATERLAQELTIIAEIGRKIASTLDIDEVFDRLASESNKLISYDRLLVTRLNHEEGVFTVVYTCGVVNPEREPGKSFPVAGSIGERVLKNRAGIILQGVDERELNRIFSCEGIYEGIISIKQIGILSLLTIPLISNDEVIGTLNFRTKKPNAYTGEDLRLAEEMGREIAGAIVNAQLYTNLQRAEKDLHQLLENLESRVQQRTIELEEVNTALRVLLKKWEQDLKKQGHDVQDNIDRLVVPFLRKLKMSSSIEQNKTYANIIETNLMHITAPFINTLSGSYKKLTPKEIQIAAMIKDGKSSKEIAELIGVSIGTITTHRDNIRKKMNLASREINLRSHLLTLS
jgi:PAS domain S-box-containing protein